MQIRLRRIEMTISETCEKYALSQDTLRYYERIGLLKKIEKNASGFREYTEQDCQRIATIKWMRVAGMPIEQLAQYIALARNGDETMRTRMNILHELRNQLLKKIDELQATHCLLNEKIERYATHVASEESCLFQENPQ